MSRLDILFMEPAFPGQFVHVMRFLAGEGRYRQVFVHDAAQDPAQDPAVRIDGVQVVGYTLPSSPQPDGRAPHPVGRDLDEAVRRGLAVADVLRTLKASGFSPSVIYAHGGFGEAMFAKRVYPDARLVIFMEYYYGASGLLGSDPEFAPDSELARQVAQVRNAVAWLMYETADVMITPTQWQRSLFPPVIGHHLHVIHDGVDTDRFVPDPDAAFPIPDGPTIRPGDPVVTFCARALEPVRGVHTVVRALPAVLQAHPQARAVLVGRRGVAYGPKAGHGRTHIDLLLGDLRRQDGMDRVHVLDWQPHDALKTLYQVSAAHVYASLPFVLSWSVLEAMSSGALVVASDTAPVREVITHGETGVLFRPGSPESLALGLDSALRTPAAYRSLRHRARHSVIQRYDLKRVSWPAIRPLLLGSLA